MLGECQLKANQYSFSFTIWRNVSNDGARQESWGKECQKRGGGAREKILCSVVTHWISLTKFSLPHNIHVENTSLQLIDKARAIFGKQTKKCWLCSYLPHIADKRVAVSIMLITAPQTTVPWNDELAPTDTCDTMLAPTDPCAILWDRIFLCEADAGTAFLLEVQWNRHQSRV